MTYHPPEPAAGRAPSRDERPARKEVSHEPAPNGNGYGANGAAGYRPAPGYPLPAYSTPGYAMPDYVMPDYPPAPGYRPGPQHPDNPVPDYSMPGYPVAGSVIDYPDPAHPVPDDHPAGHHEPGDPVAGYHEPGNPGLMYQQPDDPGLTYRQPVDPQPRRPRRAAGATDTRRAMLVYLAVPFFGFAVPLTLYLAALHRSGWLRAHAAQALNVWITGLLYSLSAAIMGAMLALDTPQVAVITVVPLILLQWLVTLAFLVRAATAASHGRDYAFPRWLCSSLVR